MSRDLLRRLLKEHTPDDARQQLAERVVEHLELSGFEVDEDGQALRRKPPRRTLWAPGEYHGSGRKVHCAGKRDQLPSVHPSGVAALRFTVP